jgi:hypothetical protein
MEHTLLTELQQLVAELERKQQETVYTIPDDIMNAVKKAKHLERFLEELVALASGSGGIQLSGLIRREFGMSMELTDHIDQWARHSKEQFEDALHDAIDRAEIRAGKQGLFFTGTLGKRELAEALELVKRIAHAAVTCQFRASTLGPEAYVALQEPLLQFYALPYVNAAQNMVTYRSLLSASRLDAMTGGHAAATAALKEHARAWYYSSGYTFLESREWYHAYDTVEEYLYLMDERQLEHLQEDYVRYIQEELGKLKERPTLDRAVTLRSMLETVLSWKAYCR